MLQLPVFRKQHEADSQNTSWFPSQMDKFPLLQLTFDFTLGKYFINCLCLRRKYFLMSYITKLFVLIFRTLRSKEIVIRTLKISLLRNKLSWSFVLFCCWICCTHLQMFRNWNTQFDRGDIHCLRNHIRLSTLRMNYIDSLSTFGKCFLIYSASAKSQFFCF